MLPAVHSAVRGDNWGPGLSHTTVLCAAEHRLRKVRMILDLGDCGPSAGEAPTLLTLPPTSPIVTILPFLLVFHLQEGLNWPLLIAVLPDLDINLPGLPAICAVVHFLNHP